jgi:hypothetical protein
MRKRGVSVASRRYDFDGTNYWSQGADNKILFIARRYANADREAEVKNEAAWELPSPSSRRKSLQRNFKWVVSPG